MNIFNQSNIQSQLELQPNNLYLESYFLVQLKKNFLSTASFKCLFMRYDYYAGVRTHYFLSSVSSHNLYTRALAHSQAFIGPLELQSLHFLSHWHIGIRTNDLKILETYYKAVTTPLGHFAKMYSTVKSQKYINQFWSKISALQSDFQGK